MARISGTLAPAVAPGGTISQPWTAVASKLLQLTVCGSTSRHLEAASRLKRERMVRLPPLLLNVQTSGGPVNIERTQAPSPPRAGNEKVVTVPWTEKSGVALPPAAGMR